MGVAFADAVLQDLFQPFLGGPLSWERFFRFAEECSRLEAEDLVALQARLLEALAAGAYTTGPRPAGPITLLGEDGEDGEDRWIPPGTTVLSHDDALGLALDDMDAERKRSGHRAVLRRLRAMAAGEWYGWTADLRLLTVLPRAHRLRTGRVMPGFRAYHREEVAAAGDDRGTRFLLLEVVHDGLPGLFGIEVLATTPFLQEDELRRALETLRPLLGVEVVAVREGELVPVPDFDPDESGSGRDGVLLLRAQMDVPPADERWVDVARRAVLRPRRPARPMAADDVLGVLAEVRQDDVDATALALRDRLQRLTPSRIRAFHAGLRLLVAGLDRPEALEAATARLGWLSEDAWEDVRSGVVALGRGAIADAVARPGSFDWDVEPGEPLLAAAPEAFEARTGTALPWDDLADGEAVGALVVSRTTDEDGAVLTIRWWRDPETAGDRHRAVEGADAEVLAVRLEPGFARLRDGLQWLGPVALL